MMIDESAPERGSDPAGYTPMISAEHAERIRRWHERAYAAAKAEAGSGQTFDYLGRTFVVPPEVQPITPVVAEADTVKDGWRVDYVTFRVTR